MFTGTPQSNIGSGNVHEGQYVFPTSSAAAVSAAVRTTDEAPTPTPASAGNDGSSAFVHMLFSQLNNTQRELMEARVEAAQMRAEFNMKIEAKDNEKASEIAQLRKEIKEKNSRIAQLEEELEAEKSSLATAKENIRLLNRMGLRKSNQLQSATQALSVLGLDATGDASMDAGSPLSIRDSNMTFDRIGTTTDLATSVSFPERKAELLQVHVLHSRGAPATSEFLCVYLEIDSPKFLAKTTAKDRLEIIEELQNTPELGHTKFPKRKNRDENLISLAGLLFPGNQLPRDAFVVTSMDYYIQHLKQVESDRKMIAAQQKDG